MSKISKSSSYSSSSKNKKLSESSISQRNKHGYRPNGDKSSDCSAPPFGGSSIQNKCK